MLLKKNCRMSVDGVLLNSTIKENKIPSDLTWEKRRWWLFVSCNMFLQDPGLLSQNSLTPHFVQCAFLERNWSGSSVMFGLTCACCSWMYQWVLSARSYSCKTQEAPWLWCLSGFVGRPPACVWKQNLSFIRPNPNASQTDLSHRTCLYEADCSQHD